MRTLRLEYSELKLPAFIPSISGTAFDLRRLLPHVINAIRVSKYSSIMLSVYDLEYALLSTYGKRIAEQKESVHQCFSLDRNTAVFLDSGALESTNIGGRLIWESPLDVYAFQKMAKADMWTILDYPTLPNLKIEENKKRIDKTIGFAREINHLHNLNTPLMAVAHGYDQESLINCAEELAKLKNVQVIAVPAWREPFYSSTTIKLQTILKVRRVIDQIDSNKYLHLLGCGRMRRWPLYALCGVNTVDTTDWLAYKANPQKLTWHRHPKKINVKCGCKICREFPGMTAEQVCQARPVFRLQHNLFVAEGVMDKIRKRIYDGSLNEYARSCDPNLYSNLAGSLGWKNLRSLEDK